MPHIACMTQYRVFVPAGHAETSSWEEYLCNNFCGFSVNPSELIKGAWRNPDTGKIEWDTMAVYYVWTDVGDDELSIIMELGEAARRIFSERAVSVIIDRHIEPTIVG